MLRLLSILFITHIPNFMLGQKPSYEPYHWFAPKINKIPIWEKKSDHVYRIEKFQQTSLNNRSVDYTILQYDSSGIILSETNWEIDDLKYLRSLNYIKTYSYDSILNYQVFKVDGGSYKEYDSIKFNNSNIVQYHLYYLVNLTKTTPDTVDYNQTILEYQFENNYSYKYLTLMDSILYEYSNGRPVKSYNRPAVSGLYNDSLVYNSHGNFELVYYYFKSKRDTSYYLGAIDSIQKGNLITKTEYSRYNNDWIYYTKYEYDRFNNQISKMSSGGFIYTLKLFSKKSRILHKVDCMGYYSSISDYLYTNQPPFNKDENWKTVAKIR